MEADIVKLLDKHKAWLAFFVPLIASLGSAIASWIVTGNLDWTEVRLAAAGVLTSIVTAVCVYLAPAKRAVIYPPKESPS